MSTGRPHVVVGTPVSRPSRPCWWRLESKLVRPLELESRRQGGTPVIRATCDCPADEHPANPPGITARAKAMIPHPASTTSRNVGRTSPPRSRRVTLILPSSPEVGVTRRRPSGLVGRGCGGRCPPPAAKPQKIRARPIPILRERLGHGYQNARSNTQRPLPPVSETAR
jgi:hypothetical protein